MLFLRAAEEDYDGKKECREEVLKAISSDWSHHFTSRAFFLTNFIKIGLKTSKDQQMWNQRVAVDEVGSRN